MRKKLLWGAGVMLGVLVVAFLCLAGWKGWKDRQDMRFYRFDSQAMAWLDALPSTCEACVLHGLSPDSIYLLHPANADTLTTMFEGETLPRSSWIVETKPHSVTAPEMKARYCDACIARMAAFFGPDTPICSVLVTPIRATDLCNFLPVQDGAWGYHAHRYCLHVDEEEPGAYNITRILLDP